MVEIDIVATKTLKRMPSFQCLDSQQFSKHNTVNLDDL